MSIDRLWAGWRMPYVSGVTGGPVPGRHDAAVVAGDDPPGCIFCAILGRADPEGSTHVVWRGSECAALLNAYPYASGHLLVMPTRHVADLGELRDPEAAELWGAMCAAVVALRSAYAPEGLNIGFNLGRAAGAGIPGHLHAHVVPRWVGDTNFMTSLAECRVLPEALAVTGERLRAAWPG